MNRKTHLDALELLVTCFGPPDRRRFAACGHTLHRGRISSDIPHAPVGLSFELSIGRPDAEEPRSAITRQWPVEINNPLVAIGKAYQRQQECPGRTEVRVSQEFSVRLRSRRRFTNQPMTLVSALSIGGSSGLMRKRADSSCQSLSQVL